MFGFVVFSGRDEVVYVNGNAQMRIKLKLKQAEFSNESSSTSGYSEMGSSADRLPNSPIDQHIGKKKINDFDLNALTQYFLPLVILYRAKEEFDADPYRHIKVRGMQLLFRPMRERFLLVVFMSSATGNAEKMERFSKDIAAAFSLHFGPLLPLFTSAQSPMKSCRRKLNKAIDEIVANVDRPALDNHQWLARCVDVCAHSYSYQTPLAQELVIVANELHLFLGISHCLIINNRQLLAAHSTSLARNGSTVQVLPVRDILLLLRSGSQTTNRPPRTKPKCQQAWLAESSSADKSHRTLWDVFRVEIVAGTELVCLGEANCAQLVSKIAILISSMNKMRMSHELEFLVNRCDHLVSDVCRHLLDMVPEESTGAESLLMNLHRTAQSLQSLWDRLSVKLTAATATTIEQNNDAQWTPERRERVAMEMPVDFESQISYFSSQLRILMQELVAKSIEAARKYKMMLFDRTCTRLKFSHFSSTKALQQTPPISFPSISPSILNLDLHAYFFICRSKRLCFCHIPAENRHEFNMAIIGALEKKSLHSLALAKLSQIDSSDDSLTVLVTNTAVAPTQSKSWSKSRMRSVWGTLTKKSTRHNLLEFGEIPEPVWCLAMFDSYIHKNLAVAQTRKLATILYDRTTLVQWSFR